MDAYDKKGDHSSDYLKRIGDIRQLAEQAADSKETDERNMQSLAGLVRGLLDELQPAIAEVDGMLTTFGPYRLFKGYKQEPQLIIKGVLRTIWEGRGSGYRSLTGPFDSRSDEIWWWYTTEVEQAEIRDYHEFPDKFPEFVDKLVRYAEEKITKRLQSHQEVEEISTNALAVLEKAKGALSAKVKQALG